MITDLDLVSRLRAAGCVFAEEEAAVLREAAAGDPALLGTMLAARVAGEPLEHVVGWVDFAGRRWAVEPGVFVPRQRTELLVREAVALGLAPGSGRPVVVADLCCGCGAVGGAVAAGLSDAGRAVELCAADIDPVAAAVAARNLAPWGAHVAAGDLDAPLPRTLRGRVDLLLCNAPYVPTDAVATLPPEAREHEPLVALDGGADGLDILRRVMDAAPGWLRPGGHLLFETGEDQVSSAVGHAEEAGLSARVIEDEEAGALGVVATRP